MADSAHHIDVHHHVIPPLYRDALRAAGVIDPIAGVDYPEWTLDQSLELMDQHAIQVALLSITDPGVGFVDGIARQRLARDVNEYLAELVRDRPDRFGAFAVLPLPDSDAALDELEYAIDELGLDGIGLLTNYAGVYPGDAAIAPVLEEADRRGLPVFIHPASPPAQDQPRFGLPVSLYEFAFETTRMVANLLYSGTLDRHPDLRVILCHAGGAVPFLASRLRYGPTIAAGLAARAPRDLIGSLQRLYYDTAMSASPYALPSLRALLDSSQILFGTDFPFMPEQTTIETLAGIGRFDGFSADELEAVTRHNALALFPRLQRALTPAVNATENEAAG
jgi:predicted TIM-barrel fold metal-dependent hydrolase